MGFFDAIPVHMDYQGQKNAENIFQVLLVIIGIIGFGVGYVFQQFSYTMFILGGGCVVGALITLPPWPMYRCNPIEWQIPVEDTHSPATTQSKSSKSKKQK